MGFLRSFSMLFSGFWRRDLIILWHRILGLVDLDDTFNGCLTIHALRLYVVDSLLYSRDGFDGRLLFTVSSFLGWC